MKKHLLIWIVMLVTICSGFAQNKNHWLKTTQSQVSSRLSSTRYQVFGLEMAGLKSDLASAPDREKARGITNLVVVFPNPDGVFERYKVMEASVLHPELAAKYPGIKSYAGQGIDDPTASIRFSVSNQTGFHGMVLSAKQRMFFIDPTTTKDHSNYIVYSREGLERGSDFSCLTSSPNISGRYAATAAANTISATNDKKMRKYRLSLSCTAEYGNIFHGAPSGTQKHNR
ncbi:MAG: hypothetical protein HY015_04485 [Bacteroidetes bacterium]|nr:hypothetical protein [Bacteroidota bacterium]